MQNMTDQELKTKTDNTIETRYNRGLSLANEGIEQNDETKIKQGQAIFLTGMSVAVKATQNATKNTILTNQNQ
jgi:hypothetical protein